MGDTGSMFLGGMVVAIAYALNCPLILLLTGIIYVIEGASDVLQIGYFKITHGKRIFKMAPLHHHFQKQGTGDKGVLWQHPFNAIPESKITVRFWIIGIFLAILTFITLKIR